MSEILYKKKSLRFSGCGLSKAVRLKEHSENRKSSRSEILNARRNICLAADDSLVSEPEPPKEEAVAVKVIPKPLSRLEQLKKWKEEKALKKKIELENKRKGPFVVGKAKPTVGCSVMNSSTLFGAKNMSRIIPPKNTSSLNILKNTNRVTPKVNLPASSMAKPGSKNLRLPAPSMTKPVTKSVTTSSVSQKFKPQSSLPALSTTAKDKPQVKSGIPSFPSGIPSFSRIPSRNLTQVDQGTKTVNSRVPACKPSIQLKKDVKENPSVGKTDGKKNPPDRVGKIAGKAIGPAPLSFKNEKRNVDSKFLKPLPAGIFPKPVVSKNTVKKPVENNKTAAEQKIEPRRKSFAPENFNFKFATKLPLLDLDLSIFEGIDFSRKTSTPLKETPVPSPEIAKINSETGSKRLLSDISECTDDNANKSKNTIAEVDTNINTDAVFVPDIIENEKKEAVDNDKENKSVNAITEVETNTTEDKEVLPNVSAEEKKEAGNVIQHISEEIGELKENIAKINEPGKNEGSSADDDKSEVGDKNITRRHRGGNSKVLSEIVVTEFESLSDVKPSELLCNPRLCSIKEELECSSLDVTPVSNRRSLRRSLRLAKMAQKETPAKVENSGASTNSTDLSEAFKQLQVVSTKFLEDDLEPQLPTKEMKPNKVSLLYTPPSSRYSLRKSVRGDLISFS